MAAMAIPAEQTVKEVKQGKIWPLPDGGHVELNDNDTLYVTPIIEGREAIRHLRCVLTEIVQGFDRENA